MAHVLIVDDDATIRRIVERVLRERGHTSEQAESGETGLLAARARRPDLILLDLNMGGMDGLETLACLMREVPGVQVVMMTGAGSVDIAVTAFKLGAVDFVTKPFEDGKLQLTIDALLAPRVERVPSGLPALVGESVRFRETMDLALKFARPDINILLEGETGTGKELFARAIHAASKRANGAFVPVDCSIFSESLIESELFGHEKGAFTGATSTRVGHFERADGGTLFLDEIGNLSPAFQAKLLRVLQERTLERVGGGKVIKIDIRVISATNVNVRDAVAAGTFRNDLFYRLADVTIRPPPLRERVGDVERIATYFTRFYAEKFGVDVRGISPRAMECLVANRWSGNVRELESVIKAAVVTAGDVIELKDLPSDVIDGAGAGGPVSLGPASLAGFPGNATFSAGDGIDRSNLESMLRAGLIDLKSYAEAASEQAVKAMLTEVLQTGRYSHAELAKLLSVDPKTLRVKLKKYGLD